LFGLQVINKTIRKF